ncbi:hypothetical protein J3458_021839 [Metarhizium acridum]|uniref:uncharacterized protein n=1 Tax=Metarhizium acridum TaxID=92637 RepID=UPI001C6BFB34|nr:hypothetical protein J3458_021839 [Metarhizium acridum]
MVVFPTAQRVDFRSCRTLRVFTRPQIAPYNRLNPCDIISLTPDAKSSILEGTLKENNIRFFIHVASDHHLKAPKATESEVPRKKVKAKQLRKAKSMLSKRNTPRA